MIFKLLLLLLVSSCSFFIEKIDSPLVDDKEYLNNIPKLPTHCPIEEKVNFQLIGSNANSQSVYLHLIESLDQKLDIFDHLALWSLIQLTIRPDQSSPTSRFQVLFHIGEKTHYYDFFSEESEEQYPYLYGLQWILKKFKKQRSLEYYASILDRSLKQRLKVGKDFENFLVKNRDFIKENEELAPYYFRGTEVLKENETSPRLNYQKVVQEFRRAQNKQKVIVNTSLIQFVTEKGNSGSCNYDFNLYSNSIFLIDKIIPVANLFGLSTSSGAFMASSSQKLNKALSLKGLPLFRGESKVRSSAVCVIEKPDKKIWTFSNQSRDPGQHLFHLVRYGLPQTKSIEEVDKLLRYSRHLFLSDPVRLIIESQRSQSDQIENLLKLNLPIYNAQKLGNIWSYAKFGEKDRFIIDDRNPGAFLCK